MRPIDQLVLGSARFVRWLVPEQAQGVVPPVPLRAADADAEELVRHVSRVAR
jgi:hypothetical protein